MLQCFNQGDPNMSTAATQVVVSADATADVDLAVAADDQLVIMGYCIAETAAVPAVAEVQIINGADGTGQIVAPVFCAASATHNAWFGPQGIPARDGITIERIAGTTSVSVYYKYV
jgi:hypothetical protein